MENYSGHDLKTINEKTWQSLTYGVRPNKELNKIQMLAYTFNLINADIYFLSEVGGAQSLENFNQHFLGNHFDIYHEEGNSPRGIDVAYMVRKNLPYEFKLTSFKNKTLRGPTKKKLKFSRNLLQLSLRKKKEKNPWLTLLLVHLKSKLSNPNDFEGSDQRRAEVNSIISHYQKMQKKMNGKGAIILGGDMNSIATIQEVEPEFDLLYRKTDLKDIHDLKNSTLEERCSYVHFQGGRRYLNQLDYLFLSETLHSKIIYKQSYNFHYLNKHGEAIIFPENRKERQLLPSDHYPVIVTLKV